LVAAMPQSKRKMEKQMASDRYIRQRNELNRQAREFLRTILAAGPQPYSVIVARAAEAGISVSTLLTAKQALRVDSRKVNKRTTLWSLPPVVS
jgi:DNA invertase Pin-like site-specific DNA recombinase